MERFQKSLLANKPLKKSTPTVIVSVLEGTTHRLTILMSTEINNLLGCVMTVRAKKVVAYIFAEECLEGFNSSATGIGYMMYGGATSKIGVLYDFLHTTVALLT